MWLCNAKAVRVETADVVGNGSADRDTWGSSSNGNGRGQCLVGEQLMNQTWD